MYKHGFLSSINNIHYMGQVIGLSIRYETKAILTEQLRPTIAQAVNTQLQLIIKLEEANKQAYPHKRTRK